MRVFRGYIRLIWRNRKLMLMYLVIFFAIFLMIAKLNESKAETSYTEEKINMAVINKDHSTLGDGIEDYLRKTQNVIDVGESKGEMQTALFYRKVMYIVMIPEHFQEDFLKDDAELAVTGIQDAEEGVYADTQIETFLNSIRVYLKSGYPMEEAIRCAREQSQKKAEVSMMDLNGNGGKTENYVYLFQYYPYMIIAVLGYSISVVLMHFRKKEIRQRMACSEISSVRQNLEGVSAFILTAVVIWLIVMAAVLVFYGKRFMLSPNKGYYILNTLTLLIAALAIAFLMGMVVKNSNMLTGAVNTISLGMCFLCGVFVPMELIGDNVKKVAQFLPAYWYEVINNLLGTHAHLTKAMHTTLLKGYAIQLVFAAACISIALVVSKKEIRSET